MSCGYSLAVDHILMVASGPMLRCEQSHTVLV